jgi:nitrogen PTS system EIIA component
MTELSDFIAPDAVLADLAVTGRKALFQQLAQAAASSYALDAKLVAERLAAREKLGSTGFGGGIAIPHAKLEGLERVVGLFARLTQPVDVGAVDDLPVDLVFLLLSPPSAGADHLKALACVSRRLRDRSFTAKLRGAGSRDALVALLIGGESRDAA